MGNYQLVKTSWWTDNVSNSSRSVISSHLAAAKCTAAKLGVESSRDAPR